MFDCANVEMRELLPELAAGSLDAVTRARVEAHVAGCAECASELETLRLVRAAFATAPVVDTTRIVALLPTPTAVAAAGVGAREGSRAKPMIRRWFGWRVAAALTTITVGGLSLAVSQRTRVRATTPPGAIVPELVRAPGSTVMSGSPAVAILPDTPGASVPGSVAPGNASRTTASTKIQLSFGGGVDDLDAASITALLGALDEIDRSPVAPLAEPDREPALPDIAPRTP